MSKLVKTLDADEVAALFAVSTAAVGDGAVTDLPCNRFRCVTHVCDNCGVDVAPSFTPDREHNRLRTQPRLASVRRMLDRLFATVDRDHLHICVPCWGRGDPLPERSSNDGAISPML